MHPKIAHCCTRAFSLIEMALVIAISGLMIGFVLQANQSTAKDCYADTRAQMATIRTAMDSFARKYDRLPMPARRDIGVENVNYGRESTAGFLTVAGLSTWGALPFQALGLPTSYGADCWGNKFTYVVTTALTTNATSGGYLDTNVIGALTVKSTAATTSGTAAYAIISHGEDGLGAVKANATSASWCSTLSATLKTYNCLGPSTATIADAVFNNGQNAGANYFDDIIIAAGRPQVLGGNLYCWGRDTGGNGILADGNSTAGHTSYTPVKATSNVKFTSFSTPTGNSWTPCGLTADGTAYCWGDNGDGNVGDGTTTNRNVPTKVNTTVKFKKLFSTASGNNCGISLTDDTAWCWGWGGYCTLPSCMGRRTSPIQIDPAIAFTKIIASPNGHGMCGLSTTHIAYCWGSTAVTAIAGHQFQDINGFEPVLGLSSAGDPAGAGKLYTWTMDWGGNLGNTGLIPLTITNITKGFPTTVTYTPGSHSLVGGDSVYIQNVQGMNEVNLKGFVVIPGHYTATTFELSDDWYSGVNIDSTSWGAYTSGGQAAITSTINPTLLDNQGGLTFTKIFSNKSALTNTGQIYTWGANGDDSFANGTGGISNGCYPISFSNTNPIVVTYNCSTAAYSTGDSFEISGGGDLVSVKAQAGSYGSITLNAADPGATNAYNGQTIMITGGTGAGQIYSVVANNGATKIATTKGWTTVPDATSQYLVGARSASVVTWGGNNWFTLDASASNVTGFYNGMTVACLESNCQGQTRTVTSYDGPSRVATLNSAWAAPAGGYWFTYLIGTPLTAQAGSAPSVTLNAGANATNAYYTGQTINIVGGSGSNQTVTITGYTGATRVATIQPGWNSPPDSTSDYTIGYNLTYKVFHVGAVGANTLQLRTIQDVPVDATKWSTINNGGGQRIPNDGSCFIIQQWNVQSCSFTMVPATQTIAGVPFTVSDYSINSMNTAVTSDGIYASGGFYPAYTVGDNTWNNNLKLFSKVYTPTFTLAGTIYPQGGSGNCMISTVGDTYCWGQNATGSLGSGNNTNYNHPNMVVGGLKFIGLLPVESTNSETSGMCGIVAP